MNPGDLILVKFPRTDLVMGKLPPALVVAISPGRYPDILLAMVSSQIHQTIPDFDEMISSTEPDFIRSGLKVDSVVRLSRLVTVDISIPEARLGRISAERLHRIRSRLVAWLQT